MSRLRLPNNGWTPRDDQMPLWIYLEGGGKRAVEVAHRRWGKDDIGLHFTATAAMRRVANYWHMLPQYGQARKAIWDAVNPRTGMRRIDEAFPERIRKNTRKQDMFIEFINGSTWQLVGSDNYDAIVGSSTGGIVFSEWALADPMAWAYLSPILEENKGWALWIYTSRGANHGKTMFESAQRTKGWFAERLTALETPVFTKKQLDQIRLEYINIFGPELGNALFSQEYYCSFEGAVMGAYFASALIQAKTDGRITKVPHHPGIEVDTFWDLGIDDSTAIWFLQPMGQAYHWIDYEEGVGFGMGHYAKILKNKPYVYGNHYMPHDARNRVQSEGILAVSTKKIAENVGIKPIIVVNRPRSMDVIIKQHIPACRNAIATSWFDEIRCKQGLEALENYRADYDEKRKVLSEHPKHDWSCLSGETKIRTLNGWIAIQDLVGKEFYVWAYNIKQHRLKPVKALKCWQAKIATELVKITLDDGHIIQCTPDHRFMLRDESWIEAKDLTINSSLMPFYETKDRNYIKIHLNDGTQAEEHQFVYSVFNGLLENGYHIHHKDFDKCNNNPENLIKMSIREHISLHSKQPERLKKLRINAKKSNHAGGTIHLIKMNKNRAGEAHHTRQKNYWTDEKRKKIGDSSIRSFKSSEKEKICAGCGGIFIGNWKRLYCCNGCKSYYRNKTHYFDEPIHSEDCRIISTKIKANNHKVMSIEFLTDVNIPVYDIYVYENHNFVAEGVVVHNSHSADAFRTFVAGYQRHRGSIPNIAQYRNKGRAKSWMIQ